MDAVTSPTLSSTVAALPDYLLLSQTRQLARHEQALQMLLSHRDPHLTLGGLVARLVRDGLERYDPARPPRARRPGGGVSVASARTVSTPAQRETEAVRQSDVERDDASFGAAVPDSLPGSSAPKRHSKAEHGSVSLAAALNRRGHTSSPAKRHSEAGHGGVALVAVSNGGGDTTSAPKRDSGSVSPAAAPNSGGHTGSAAKDQSEAELGRAVRDGGGRTASAAGRGTEAAHGGAKSAAVQDVDRSSDSAAKRVRKDEDTHVEEAQRPRGAPASAPGHRRETQHAGGQPKAMRGSGRAASLAKQQGRADGDGREAGVGGLLARAACAAGPQFETHRSNLSRAPVRGGRRYPTSRPPAAGSPSNPATVEKTVTVISVRGFGG